MWDLMFITATLLNFALCSKESSLTLLEQDEDQKVINETLTKYGFPMNFQNLSLPGPEIATDSAKFIHSNRLEQAPGSFVLRIRSITEYFSYNGRYENTTVKKVDNQEVLNTRGQFGEHFKRRSGGYYIRTVGYILDENGYRQFLIDLSTAQTIITRKQTPVLIIDAPKVTVSSTVLATLIGGNSVG